MRGWYTKIHLLERINHDTSAMAHIEGVPLASNPQSSRRPISRADAGRKYASAPHILLLASLVVPGARCLVRLLRRGSARRHVCAIQRRQTASVRSPDHIPYHLHVPLAVVLLRGDHSIHPAPAGLIAIPAGRKMDNGGPGTRTLKKAKVR